MQCNIGKRRLKSLTQGFAGLCAALVLVADGGSASAAPTETVLYNFCTQPNCSDGFAPQGGLIADSAGNLYGTAEGGGSKRWTYRNAAGEEVFYVCRF